MLGGGNTIYHVKRVGFMCDIAPLSVWKEALEMQYALIVQWVPYPPSTGFSWDEVMTVQQAMTRVELLGVNGPIDGLEWNLK